MERPRRLWSGVDVVLALALSIAVQVEIWRSVWVPLEDPEPDLTDEGRWIAGAFALALTLSIAVRRRYPLLGLALAFPTLVAMGSGGLDGLPALTVTLMVVVFSVGSGTRDSKALVGAVGVGCLLTVAILRDPDARLDLGDLVLPILVLGGAWLAGLALRIRHDQERALEERAARLERDQESLAAAAVADERVRIGRELHDVIAHAIGIIVVQARGGRASLPADPGATREALDAIETTGMQALTEMHRLVGIIRSEDEQASRTPPPGLRDLDRLIDQVREAGLPVDVAVEGTPVDVAPGVDLSAYRIVQEALTNALRHAGTATARVRIAYAPTDLELEITDTGVEGSAGDGRDGLGLVGMRERATLVGGSLEVESVSGGFVVRAHLPLATDPR